MPDTGPRRPLHPLAALGFVAFCAGLVAWLWLGQWRWAATGAVVLVAFAFVAVVIGDRRDRHRL